MEESSISRKKMKSIPSPEVFKNCILTSNEPLILKNVLSWDLLNWSLEDWVEKFGNLKVDVRMGTKHCTKTPQWESSCEVVSIPLGDLLNEAREESNDTWMYFDYKHMTQIFKTKSEILESISWADFGFPDKSGKDSTIWIGTQGAYTPCHMDSYGCNIVAQVYGRKLWVLYPPNKVSALKPTRVPYEESSTYSNVHFSCGLSNIQEVGEARVVELSPGDVLLVPNHWWHYVENLSTAISINMWIPLESDNTSRLEESLVRFVVASTLKALDTEEETALLNPNEMDLLDEPVDLTQISWCVDQLLIQEPSGGHMSNPTTSHGGAESAPATSSSEDMSSLTPSLGECVCNIPSMSAVDLQRLLLTKCGCVKDSDEHTTPTSLPLSAEHVISAFCHPDVIAKVAELLISMKKI